MDYNDLYTYNGDSIHDVYVDEDIDDYIDNLKDWD